MLGYRARVLERFARLVACVIALASAAVPPAAGAAANGLIAVQTTGPGRRIATLDLAHPLPQIRPGLPIDSTDAAWSRDGTMLAFSSTLRGAAELSGDDAGGDIYVYSAKGGLRLITFDDADEIEPTWSPDGRRIAYTSRKERGAIYSDIYVKDIFSGTVRRLTHQDPEGRFGVANRGPVWSPDGTLIAFTSDRIAEADPNALPFSTDIWLMAPDGTKKRRLTYAHAFTGDTDETHPAWSADSARLAFSSGGPFSDDPYAVWSIDRSGSNAKQLTKPFLITDDDDALDPFGDPIDLTDGAFPAWSPDGKYIAFSANRDLQIVPSGGDVPMDSALLAREVTEPAWAGVPTPRPTPKRSALPGVPVMSKLSIPPGKEVDGAKGILVTLRPVDVPASTPNSSVLVQDATFTVARTPSRRLSLDFRPAGCSGASVRAARTSRRRPHKPKVSAHGPNVTLSSDYLTAGSHGTRYLISETCGGSFVSVNQGVVEVRTRRRKGCRVTVRRVVRKKVVTKEFLCGGPPFRLAADQKATATVRG